MHRTRPAGSPLLASLPVLLATLALLPLGACAPKINPAMQRATETLLAQPRTARNVSSAASYEPLPWAPGQIVVQKTTDRDRGPAVTKTSVISREADGSFWVEFDTQDFYHRTVTRVLYRAQPRTARESTDFVVRYGTSTDGGPMEWVDPREGSPVGDLYRRIARVPIMTGPPDAGTRGRETITVPAGTFSGSVRFPVRVVFGPFEKGFTGWYHPVVPVNGSVKAVADDGSVTVELLDYDYGPSGPPPGVDAPATPTSPATETPSAPGTPTGPGAPSAPGTPPPSPGAP